MKKHFLRLMICLLALMLASSCAMAAEIAEIQKYGNLILSVTGSEFLRQGYTYGDIITVSLNGMQMDMPVGSSYSDVEEGSLICRVEINDETGDDAVILAVNMGDLATGAGVAVKNKTEEEPGYRWDWLIDRDAEVSFRMKQAGGYLNEFLLRHLVRTNAREDYVHLTDEQFANFRPVATSGMGEGVLYRSSSPVNPELGRSAYADQALGAAGVKTILNLADSPEEMRSYEGFAASAYAQCSVIPLNLGIDFTADDFKQGLAEGLRFLAAGEGPYLVHCTEGKDRAGFVSALLECLMGATLDEVTADYMTTYFQYYGVETGTQQYAVLAESNIQKSLMTAFELESLDGADLAAEAEAYLMEALGLSGEEIARIKENLSGN